MSQEILWGWALWLYYSPPKFILHEILPLQKKHVRRAEARASGYLVELTERAPHMQRNILMQRNIMTRHYNYVIYYSTMS